MVRISRRRFVGATAAAGAGLLTSLAGTLPAEAAATLPRRQFGATGVEVTVIGLGGGSRFTMPVPDDEQGAEIVRRAIDRGICFIETSANYGPNGESEKRIGAAMRTHRSKVFLETKVDARDYDGAMREIDRSLKRLRTNRLDLVLHNYITKSWELRLVAEKGGAELALRKMIDQKVVRFRGFSCHSPALTAEGIKQLEPHAIQIIANATRVPNFETEVLPLAKARGVAVIAMKSCGKGYFLPHNATKPDRIDEFGPPRRIFERRDLPTARDYLSYSLSQPVATVVVGIDSFETLDSLLKDVSGYAPLAPADLKSIADRAQAFRTTGFWIPNPRLRRSGG